MKKLEIEIMMYNSKLNILTFLGNRQSLLQSHLSEMWLMNEVHFVSTTTDMLLLWPQKMH